MGDEMEWWAREMVRRGMVVMGLGSEGAGGVAYCIA